LDRAFCLEPGWRDVAAAVAVPGAALDFVCYNQNARVARGGFAQASGCERCVAGRELGGDVLELGGPLGEVFGTQVGDASDAGVVVQLAALAVERQHERPPHPERMGEHAVEGGGFTASGLSGDEQSHDLPRWSRHVVVIL
jgi:hypothetical protein